MEKLHNKEMEWLHENLTLVASPLEIPILKNTGFGTGGQKLRPAVRCPLYPFLFATYIGNSY